jgi:DNA-binding MarR family transcriptional regulator
MDGTISKAAPHVKVGIGACQIGPSLNISTRPCRVHLGVCQQSPWHLEKILDKLKIGVYTPIMSDQAVQIEFAKSKSAECACGNLRKAARAVTQVYDEVLRPTGLRVTQFGILGATMAMEPVTLTRLADATVTDRTTLTRNLKLLEKRGLIRVQMGNDRREREVTLTARGREALASGLPLWQKAQTRVIQGLGEEQWNALRDGLSAVVSLARAI